MSTIGPKTRRGRVTFHGFVPATDPLYQSDWKFISGKNLNPPSGKASSETPSTKPPAPEASEADEQQEK